MAGNQISLKLLIDKQSNRVAFAESNKDFIDILLSFLTMPMGTIIRLLGKKSTVGCMDTLYESVENLDAQYLETDACKTMLLYPRNAAEDLRKSLAVNIGDQVPSSYYICSSWSCTSKGYGLITSLENVRCRCGKQMNRLVFPRMPSDVGDAERGFVKERVNYLISDDLHVTPDSVENTLSLLAKLGVQDEASLEVRSVNVGVDEVLYLLNCVLLSNTPLTDAFLRERDIFGVKKLKPIDMTHSQPAIESSSNTNIINVKLLLSKSNNKVLLAEGREDFVDLLFRFLTFPLGSIIKHLDGNSGMGCIDHLYKSVVNLSVSEHLKSDKCKAMLLTPMLASHYGCKNHLLDIDEVIQGKTPILGCETCVQCNHVECSHYWPLPAMICLASKDPKRDRESGGGFVRGPTVFMVSDELSVKTLSSISFLSGLNTPITDIDKLDVSLGEKEALALLKVSLLSKTALSHAFAKSPDREISPEQKPELLPQRPKMEFTVEGFFRYPK